MKKLIKFLFQAKPSHEDRYLSESVDIYMLERRMREIQQGIAPYQIRFRTIVSHI